MSAKGFLPGFENPVPNSQSTYRVILEAMAGPGRELELPVLPQAPPTLYPSTAAVCLTLLDLDTPLWLDSAAASTDAWQYLHFHCGCPPAPDPGLSTFAVMGDGTALTSFNVFPQGEAAYPDRSATLIIQVQGFDASAGRRLTGPGIETQTHLQVSGLAENFWSEIIDNHQSFPLGVDVILASPCSICALPRTTKVEG